MKHNPATILRYRVRHFHYFPCLSLPGIKKWQRNGLQVKSQPASLQLAYTPIICPVGAMLSAGGLPVCFRIFFLSHFSDFSLSSQNSLIQPCLTTSVLPLKFKKKPHFSSNSHFSDMIVSFRKLFLFALLNSKYHAHAQFLILRWLKSSYNYII